MTVIVILVIVAIVVLFVVVVVAVIAAVAVFVVVVVVVIVLTSIYAHICNKASCSSGTAIHTCAGNCTGSPLLRRHFSYPYCRTQAR